MAPIFTGRAFGFGAGSSARIPVPFSATGGTVSTPGDGYKYHVFTSSDSFTTSGDPKEVEYLLVGGGGAGGNGGDSPYQGGGGGGGLVYGIIPNINANSHAVTVGSASNSTYLYISNPVSPNIIAKYGGYGGGPTYAGQPGGSGGGLGGTGDQPTLNPGNPYVHTQYGNTGSGTAGGSSTNVPGSNATFPNGSTILSGSPIGGNAIARGGDNTSFPVGPSAPATSYGSGGNGGRAGGGSGAGGVVVIRYLL